MGQNKQAAGERYTKTPEGEASIIIRLAQRHAAFLPAGVRLSEATTEQLVAAIKAGIAAEKGR